MQNQPGWRFWLAWAVAYTLLDGIVAALLHGGPAWRQVLGAVEGGLGGATLTWLFGLWRWYKNQDRF